MILIVCPKCGPLPIPIPTSASLNMMEASMNLKFKQAWEESRCRICGRNVTVKEELDVDRAEEYIALLSELNPNYKATLLALSIITFFTPHANLEGQPDDVLEATFIQNQKRAAERYEAFLRLGAAGERSPALIGKHAREITLAERAEIMRRALTGDGAVLMNLIISPQEHIMLQFLRHAVFMQIMPNLCEGCSGCCVKIKTIGLNAADLERIAAHLKMTRKEFEAKYVRTVKDETEVSMQTFKQTAPCMWLKSERCVIYAARPNVCVFYPFLTDLQRAGSLKAIVVPQYCRSGLAVVELLQGGNTK